MTAEIKFNERENNWIFSPFFVLFFQILSLNLTNLLILVLLKALIFAAGLIGAGNWGHYARARSIDCKF